MKFIIALLTCNGGEQLQKCLDSMSAYSIRTNSIFVIDSSSSDGSFENALSCGYTVRQIQKSDFNHGATRQLALTLCPDADIIIYMTQDAILASPDSIKNILAPFADNKVAAVCGRQLPHADASPIAAHARLFNYQAESSTKSIHDIPRSGIKAAFLSNSFAAYRRTALMDIGGFPSDVIFGEDTFVAAKMLQAGWKVAYAADAACYHSHNYSMMEEFRRYFDIGVFHSREMWFIASLGKPEGEGKKFVLSELRFLMRTNPFKIPSALLRTALKFAGYKLGFIEETLPVWLKPFLSMNKKFWKKPQQVK